MRFLSSAIAIAGVCVSMTASEAADTHATSNTTVGKTVRIGQYASWGGHCEHGAIPWITITKKPANGSLNTGVAEWKLVSIISGSSGCIGQMVKGVEMYYTPKSSFRGSDSIEYSVNYSDRVRHDYLVDVNVK